MNSTKVQNTSVSHMNRFLIEGKSINTNFSIAFRLYLPGIVLVVGIITNLLVLVIMRSPFFKKLPLSVYFSVLAVSDTIALLTVSLRQILQEATGANINKIDILCHFTNFFLPAASMTSSWFVVCVAVERFLVVKYPMKAKKISTKKNAVIAVIGVSSASVILNSFSLWIVDYTKPNCTVHYKFTWVITYSVRAYIFLSTFNVIPILIISCCYIMVVWILKKKQQQVLPHSGAAIQKLTTTAIMICLFFTILTMPVTVSLAMVLDNKYNQMFHDVSQFLRLLNHGTNFFIYLLCNAQFKTETKKLFRLATVVAPASGDALQSGNTQMS